MNFSKDSFHHRLSKIIQFSRHWHKEFVCKNCFKKSSGTVMPATWGDVFSLVIISTLFFGCIGGFIYATESAKKAVA